MTPVWPMLRSTRRQTALASASMSAGILGRSAEGTGSREVEAATGASRHAAASPASGSGAGPRLPIEPLRGPAGEVLPALDDDVAVQRVDLDGYARRPICSAAMSVEPEPANGSKTASPGRRWLRIGISERSTGFWVGWSSLRSLLRHGSRLGLGARQIVAWSRSPMNRFGTPGRRTTTHGSWARWFQERPTEKRPLSQMIWPASSNPMPSRPWSTSRVWTLAYQT